MNAIGREILGLHEAAYLLALFAAMSLVLALVRDKLLAFAFGAGHTLDIYYAAFRIPDFLFASVGSLVSASILLPYFIERFERSRQEGRAFSDSIFTVFFGLMAVAAGVAYFIAPWLVPLVIPGFDHDPSLPQLITTMRIMLLSPFFLGLSNLYSSLTQMHHRFLVYAASPVVYNAGIIIGVVGLYPIFGIPGLALGVAIGAIFHVGIQVPFMTGEGLLPRFTRKIDWTDTRKIALSSLPRTITLSANQLASFVLVSMASLMATGSIAVFNFAFNLQSVPLTLIGASYSSAVFPTLSRLLFKGDTKEFLEKMVASAQHIIFWSMPLTVLFIVLRAQIVRTVLGAGAFDWADTRLVAAALAIFVISTIGQSLIVLFVRGFYAEGKTSRPLLINAVSATGIVALGFALWKMFEAWPVFRFFLEDLFKVDGQVGTSVLVLALAYTLGVILNTFLHWWVFARHYKGFTRPVLETLFHSFAASVIMGYAAYLSLRIFAGVFPLTKVWGVFMQGFCSGLIGLVVLVLVLIILRNKELATVWRTLHHKIWGAAVPPAEVEHM
ncbi:MAG: oligosaccharide flippase family protein [Patescibacteria group bacterium]|nr:oligosaccharide flippase family protein [Patescibacteria group bacterium]